VPGFARAQRVLDGEQAFSNNAQMAEVGTPHDAFFKRLLGAPDAAATFLRERLPPDIAAALAPDPPEPVPGSFVDAELGLSQSDLLFRVRTVEGDEAFLYALLEHKSDPDPMVALQLLRYMVRIWDRWRRERPREGAPPRLPAIVPMVVYHGAKTWTVSTAFPALVRAPAALQPHVPAFDYLLTDLGRIDDASLSADARLQAGLRALKYIFSDDLPERLAGMLRGVPVDVVIEVLTYIAVARHFLNEDVLRAVVRRALPEQEERIMSTLAEQWEQRGEQRGLKLGEQQGLAKGKAAALLRILAHRFGEPSEPVRAAVRAADPDTLDVWIDRAFEAASPEAVVEIPRHT